MFVLLSASGRKSKLKNKIGIQQPEHIEREKIIGTVSFMKPPLTNAWYTFVKR
jgi:hypothetical protein